MRSASLIASFALLSVAACSGDSFQPAASGSGGSGGAAAPVAGNGPGGSAAGATVVGGAAGSSAGGTDAAGSGAGGEGVAGAGATGGAAGAPGGGTGGGAGSAAGSSQGGGAGTSGTGGAGGAGPTPNLCPTLFVKAGAPNDAGRGCDPQKPLGSIATALTVATASRTAADPTRLVDAIKICNGTYTEDQALVLKVPVSIEGGFTCVGDKWVLPPDASTLEYAGAPPTIINFSGVRGLSIEGAAIVKSVQVSRISLVPPPGVLAGVQSAAGIEVGDNATPTLQFVKAASQGSVGTVFGSAALVVRGGAAPLVSACVLQSGPGTITNGPTAGLPASAGSIGAFIGATAGPVEIGNSIVQGGQGATTTTNLASVGVFAFGQKLVLKSSLITAGRGETTLTAVGNETPLTTAAVAVYGLLPTKASVTILASALGGGRSKGAVGSSAVGLLLDAAAGTVEATRIYGGDGGDLESDATASKKSNVSYGALVRDGTLTAANTLVHAGGADLEAQGRPTRFTRGVALDSGRLDATHVTIFAGRGDAESTGLYLANEGGAVMTGSLLVHETASTFGILAAVSACKDSKVKGPTSFTNVVFVQPESSTSSVLFKSAPGSSCADAASPSELFSRGIIQSASQRVVEGPTVANDQLAISACKLNSSCALALFPGFDNSSGQVIVGNTTSPSCAAPLGFLQAGGTPKRPADLVATQRKTPTTPGAFQAVCP